MPSIGVTPLVRLDDPIMNSSLANLAKAIAFQTGTMPAGNANINDRFSKRHTVADLNIPRNPEAVLQLALRYSNENPFVSKAARVKTDFTCKDAQHKTHNSRAQEFYDEKWFELLMPIHVRNMVWNLFTIGVCPVYWGGEDGGDITFLQVLNPIQTKFIEVLGRYKLFIKIDTSMMKAVQDPTGQKDKVNKVVYESMPQYWIDQIRAVMKSGKADGLIELMDGSYTVIMNKYAAFNRSTQQLDGVPLQGAFDALQRYRLLAAGDFAIAWGVKNMITLISEGDPEKVNDKDYTPLDDIRLQKLQAVFQNPDYALTIFCDPTTKVEYVVPPLEAFDPKKYSQVEKEIKEVLNLPSFMWSNDGSSTFGAAAAEVELLRQEVEAVRLLLREQFFRPFYSRLRAGARRPGFAEKDIVLPTFDQNSLRDQVTWLSNVGELYSKGALSLKSYMEVNGFDFEYEMAQKQEEHDKYGNTSSGGPGEPLNNSPARPLFEPSQGNMNPIRDKGGNEGDGKGNPADTSRTPRNPRPKGK
jgi:hypothetical protein